MCLNVYLNRRFTRTVPFLISASRPFSRYCSIDKRTFSNDCIIHGHLVHDLLCRWRLKDSIHHSLSHESSEHMRDRLYVIALLQDDVDGDFLFPQFSSHCNIARSRLAAVDDTVLSGCRFSGQSWCWILGIAECKRFCEEGDGSKALPRVWM